MTEPSSEWQIRDARAHIYPTLMVGGGAGSWIGGPSVLRANTHSLCGICYAFDRFKTAIRRRGHGPCVYQQQVVPTRGYGSKRISSNDNQKMEAPAMTLVNMKQRYVSTTLCPIGKTSQPECAALASRIFEADAAASAALVEHLGSADCHTREQLARVVGVYPPIRTRSAWYTKTASPTASPPERVGRARTGSSARACSADQVSYVGTGCR